MGDMAHEPRLASPIDSQRDVEHGVGREGVRATRYFPQARKAQDRGRSTHWGGGKAEGSCLCLPCLDQVNSTTEAINPLAEFLDSNVFLPKWKDACQMPWLSKAIVTRCGQLQKELGSLNKFACNAMGANMALNILPLKDTRLSRAATLRECKGKLS